MTEQPCYPGIFTADDRQLDLFALPKDDPDHAIYGPNISLAHIVRSLSQICRFNGSTPYHYSVGQHSLIVVEYMKQVLNITEPDVLRAGLLHDAAEAYVGDIVRPLKNHIIKGFRSAANSFVKSKHNFETFSYAYQFLQCEERIQRAIFDKYSATYSYEVIAADNEVGKLECWYFFHTPEAPDKRLEPLLELLLSMEIDDVYETLIDKINELNINE